MKILFFLVVCANVALFMWEYRTGAFAPVIEISEQDADSGQEQILLVSELKNVETRLIASPPPAPVSEPPVTGTAAPEPLPAISEGIND